MSSNVARVEEAAGDDESATIEGTNSEVVMRRACTGAPMSRAQQRMGAYPAAIPGHPRLWRGVSDLSKS